MNQKHVPSMELCQQFVDLCSKNNITLPETEFYWQTYPKGETRLVPGISSFANPKNIHIPAPLVSEQGEWGNSPGVSNFMSTCLGANGWNCSAVTTKNGRRHYIAMTEPNARQAQINYLIAEEIITTL